MTVSDAPTDARSESLDEPGDEAAGEPGRIATQAGARLKPISLRLAERGDGLGADLLVVAVDGTVRRHVDGAELGSLVGLRTDAGRDGIDVGVTEFFAEPGRATGLHLVLRNGRGPVRGETRPVTSVHAD